MGDFVVVKEIPDDEPSSQLVSNTPEPQGYVIPLILDGSPERTFVHLISRAFVEHYGPDALQSDIARVTDCAVLVRLDWKNCGEIE
jgi:hypothetical protein